jgi:oligogalacturonide lyase
LLLIASASNSFGQDAATAATTQTKTPPKTWIDSVTGHRVTRLSDDPNSKGFYFDLNAYTPDGLDMIYVSPKGIYDLNLSTLESNLIVAGKVSSIVVGTKTRRVFYQNDSDGWYYVVNIDTKQVTQLHPLPHHEIVSSVNADETLLVGTSLEGTARDFIRYKLQALQDAHKALVDNRQAVVDARTAEIIAHPGAKATASSMDEINRKATSDAEEKRFASQTPEDIFTMNLQTGEVKVILKGTDWLNHVQFSPTDPTLIMYAHEGPALKVDRVWTIRADGSQNHMIHQRSNPSEIVTHEFWSHDGKTIWYDLQKTKGEDFAVGGYEVETGKDIVYHLKKAEASVHYNAAFDGSVFCGDGNVMAHGEIGVNGHRTLNRKWIELLRPAPDGTFHSTRLASILDNDYTKTEPNAHFSPDNKLVIFTSNMFGPNYVFAVEVDKAAASSTATN